ncbi:MAG: ABC transporter substrate-binding protein [Chthoniobacterales bacterium]
MLRILAVLLALGLVLGLPFVFKPKQNMLSKADDSLVIISPHNEAIRYEFTHAFSEYYQKKTGRSVRLDWRVVGGTSEISRYLRSEYLAAFQHEWESSGKKWNPEVEGAFDNPKLKLDAETPAQAQEAREAFLNSDRGIGIDIFFGGGAYDFTKQAQAGRLVPSNIFAKHPEWFTEKSLPEIVSGEVFYDSKGRWIGNCLSSFGICYNTDSLERLGVTEVPASWKDLTNTRLLKQVALADPTKSGSAAKAFEMVIQQQMQEVVREAGAETPESIGEGWERGLRLIQRASANARYFTDSAGKVPMDVSLGDAAMGMCIDFYGRYQSEAVKIDPETPARLQYFTPVGGSSVGVDPIGLLRGAPHPEVAELFIEFVLSIEGQKLWNFKVGTPGGPVRYALRRMPVRKELYEEKYVQYRSDPTVEPYEEAKKFDYHAAWTGPLFGPMSFIIRIMCLDPHQEQVAAWKALIEADFPPEATKKFDDLSLVSYALTKEKIKPALGAPNRLEEVRLAKTLGDQFREKYAEVVRLAGEGK